jgi:Na+-transporting NADH:ubiquinone oxidoreductase subunit NqrF
MHRFTTNARKLTDTITQTVVDAIDASDGGRNRANVAKQRNVVVSRNVGGQGNVRATSTRQRVRVRQNDEETLETTETVMDADGAAEGGV